MSLQTGGRHMTDLEKGTTCLRPNIKSIQYTQTEKIEDWGQNGIKLNAPVAKGVGRGW